MTGIPRDLPARPVAESYRRVARYCGLGVILIGVAGILGWALGIPELNSVIPGYQPIVISTSIIYLILGGVLFFMARPRLPRGLGIALMGITLVITVFGLLEVIKLLTGVDVSLEDVILRHYPAQFNNLNAHVSPVTGVLVFLIGLAQSLLLVQRVSGRSMRRLAPAVGVIGSLVMLISAVFLLSYLYRNPLLYSSVYIPVSVLAALAALLSGIGLIATLGDTALPLSWFAGSSTRARLLRAFLPLTALLMLLLSIAQYLLTRITQINLAILAPTIVIFFEVIITAVIVQVARVMGGLIDLAETERRRAEEELRQSEAQLSAIFENLTEGLIVSTVDGDLLQWNRAALEMHGFANLAEARHRLPEFTSLFALRTLDGAILPFEQWPLSRILRGEILRDWDIRVRRISTGTERIFSYGGALVLGTEGQPLMAVLTVNDVTDRRRAEEELQQLNATLGERIQERTTALEGSNEALRQSEERFRLMIESVKDYAIILLDPDGRVTSWNVGAERIKGYRADEILGQPFTHFYTPEDNAIGKPQAELQQAVTAGRFEDEGWRVRKDGARFWASVVITPLYAADGALFGFVKITRDISERRQAEEELLRLNADLRQRTDALEVAYKEMETFSYSVAHDLRSPLRSLDGFSKYLLAHAAERLDAQEQDYLQRMRTAAQRMARLIDDLLNLARIGRVEMNIESVNLSRLATEIIAGLRRRDPERQVEVEVTPDLIARGDRELLRIAVEHLLENAWKFTGTRETARITFGVSAQEGERVYAVRDNGVGFAMAYVGKLFQPFQRLHTEDEFPGTGIGLALIQRIIQRHGGRVWAEGVEGQGATFYFTLGEENV